MKNLMKRKQLLAAAGFVALGLLIGLVGLLVAVLPQKSKAQDLDAQIAAAQTKLVSLHGAQGPEIRAADLFQLARAMPDEPDMPGILVELGRVADRSKVTIVSISPGAPLVQVDGATALPIHLVADGSWDGISTFLHTLRTEVRVTKKKLQVDGRLFVVDSVQLASRNDSSQLEVTLNVNAFTYGEPLPPATVTDTTSTSTSTTPAPGTAQASGTPGSAG